MKKVNNDPMLDKALDQRNIVSKVIGLFSKQEDNSDPEDKELEDLMNIFPKKPKEEMDYQKTFDLSNMDLHKMLQNKLTIGSKQLSEKLNCGVKLTAGLLVDISWYAKGRCSLFFYHRGLKFANINIRVDVTTFSSGGNYVTSNLNLNYLEDAETHSWNSVQSDFKNLSEITLKTDSEIKLSQVVTMMKLLNLFYKSWLVKITAFEKQEEYNKGILEEQKKIRIKRNEEILKELDSKLGNI